MSRGIEFERRDGEVIVWKTWPWGPDNTTPDVGGAPRPAAREEVCRLTAQEALDKGYELRLAGSEAFRATLPPGVR